MTIPATALCVILGMLPLYVLPALPSGGWIAAGVVAGLLALGGPAWLKYTGVMLLSCCWGIHVARVTLAPVTDWSGRREHVEAVILASDGATTHTLSIIKERDKWIPGGIPVTVYGSYLPAAVCPGQRWAFSLVLRPVHGQLNDGGFDNQRYALSQGKVLTGRVLHADVLDARCSLRGTYIASVASTLARYPWRDVILALGFGERLNVSEETKALMRDTGTAHLMAISGLHIALAGGIGWGVARLAQRIMPSRRIGHRMPLIAGLVLAAVYTWLAGANPPALRTFIALAVCGAISLSGRHWNGWQCWLCCIGGILLIDPLTILSPSLWLSALAVAALIFWYQWVPFRPKTASRPARMFYAMAHLQAGITLLLIPLQISMFHGISLTSLFANLLAVPAITFMSVPLILAGMIMHLTALPAVEQGIWWLADRSLEYLFFVLKSLPAGWLNLDARWQGVAFIPWVTVVTWRLRLALALPGSIAALLCVALFPFFRPAEQGRWAVHMLDVGHGLALIIERNGKALLYDTGNAWAGGDSGKQIIIPWLRWHHLQPEGVILSHEHLDHRGGLDSILHTWPELWVRSPLGWARHLPCERGQVWRWQSLTFTVHWPLAGRPHAGNNGSCVVTVDDGARWVLLTGDIEADAELAMLKHHWQFMRADVIQVPHHGSRTSSTESLLAQVNGKIALASVARYNAWHLPSEKVVTRYHKRGYRWNDTAHAGQISIIFNAHGWRIARYREQILPRWYHQWFGVSADSR